MHLVCPYIVVWSRLATRRIHSAKPFGAAKAVWPSISKPTMYMEVFVQLELGLVSVRLETRLIVKSSVSLCPMTRSFGRYGLAGSVMTTARFTFW